MSREVRRQIHGGDIYRNKDVLDFSVNSNPLGAPGLVVEAVKRAAADIVHYPDIYCEELRRVIGQFENVAESEIICGNGAAELFFASVLAVMPKKALLVSPTFSEYEKALASVRADIIYYELQEEKQFEVDEGILEMIAPDIEMMFLCNPNNPTGCVVSKKLLAQILGKCRQCKVFLVLDECFIDFLEHPEMYEMKEYLKEYPELLIIKAFTKIFAMPGLRLGYGISSNLELLEKLRSVLQPWNVSVPAQQGGVAALTEDGGYTPADYMKATRKFIAEERNYVMKELKNMGFYVYDSKANYIFFRGKPDLYEEAREAGFLIRDCSDYRGLSDGYYRIAVRTRNENERLLAWLRKL